ncbi:MAG TPA: FhaA domain-containing protein [Blastocatellia bacterium]|nr:FhaA domain-containing protein [Blastocatellia bacterium]
MADGNDSIFDKAEGFARRLLERLGSRVDSKDAAETLSPREVGEITSRIERAIEANLKEDKKGVKRVAPNRFKVLFTYEDVSRLNSTYVAALAVELKTTIYEYINNRRYETTGPVVVETGRDVFAPATVVQALFDAGADPQSPRSNSEKSAGPNSGKSTSGQQPAGVRTITLEDGGGHAYSLNLSAEGAPAYIGRASGSAVRIDDPSISRLHCSIALRSNGEIVISDLGSSNGTSTNSNRVGENEARALSKGDIIGVGDVQLKVAQIA